MERNGRQLKLTFDNQPQKPIAILSVNDDLDLGTFLYVGWVDNALRLLWHLWTSNPKSFLGCILDMHVNGQNQDLQSLARAQSIIGIVPGICTMPKECSENPCIRGVCLEKWEEYQCNCVDTPYTGKQCELGKIITNFNQYFS